MATKQPGLLRLVVGPLSTRIPPDHQPVPGTTLTPDSFRPGVHGWTATLHDGSQCLITPREDGLAACFIGTAQQRFVDPATRRLGNREATVVEWFDALCRRDALVGHRPPHSWEGHARGCGRGAEMGTAVFDDEQTCLENFTTLRSAQTWLDEALAETTVRTTLYAVETWRADELPRSGWVRLALDGREVVMTGTSGERFTAVADRHALTRDRTHAELADLWLLHVEGTDACLVLPREGTNLLVDVQPETVSLQVLATEDAAALNQHRDLAARREAAAAAALIAIS